MLDDTLAILVVDDDEGDRKHIQRILKQAGLASACTEVESISDALWVCQETAFDCVLIDCQLAGEDGLAGVRAIHERLPYVAIVMMTSQGNERVATEAMKMGALDYILKNQLDPHSIARCIEDAVEKASLLETVARQREDLEVFSRVMVHDLKGTMHNVLALAHRIEGSMQSGETEKVAKYCSSLVRTANGANALIDALHQYTTADELADLKPLEMHDVMIDTLSNLNHLIQQRGASVTYGELPVVSGTPQLSQLLQNLIGNGIKYCEADPPQVHISAQLGEGNLWQFRVRDNGIGVPEEHYAQVFEPFRRLHGIGKYEGTGLGLSTCKKIVERHGGTISCESVEGQGSTFFFTLRGA